MTVQSPFPSATDKWQYQDHLQCITLPNPRSRFHFVTDTFIYWHKFFRFFHFLEILTSDGVQFIHIIVSTVFQTKSLFFCHLTHI